MRFIKLLKWYIFFILVCRICYNYDKEVNIYIANSFKNYYHLPHDIICKNSKGRMYRCNYLKKEKAYCKACIYNGNRKFPLIPNCSYNIIITTEKLSQVKFMKDIGDGKNKYYQLAVDYRLFNSKNHLSRPIYSYYNMAYFIDTAKRNFGNIELFKKRKDFVYIQRVSYRKRQCIVKELMKYFVIDSYGRDLNNREWPKYISRKDKITLLKQYKFCISIENSIITRNISKKLEAELVNNDYVTEKLTDSLIAGCIPIYFGPQNINTFLPNIDSIINFREYDSIYSLAKYLKKILSNITLLEHHLYWYNNISKEWIYRFGNIYAFDFCKICNYIPK